MFRAAKKKFPEIRFSFVFIWAEAECGSFGIGKFQAGKEDFPIRTAKKKHGGAEMLPGIGTGGSVSRLNRHRGIKSPG